MASWRLDGPHAHARRAGRPLRWWIEVGLTLGVGASDVLIVVLRLLGRW